MGIISIVNGDYNRLITCGVPPCANCDNCVSWLDGMDNRKFAMWNLHLHSADLDRVYYTQLKPHVPIFVFFQWGESQENTYNTIKSYIYNIQIWSYTQRYYRCPHISVAWLVKRSRHFVPCHARPWDSKCPAARASATWSGRLGIRKWEVRTSKRAYVYINIYRYIVKIL